MVAGLPPVYGLYTSVVTAFVSALMNNSQHVICGPTNAISLMVASTWLTAADPAIRQNPAAVVTLLTFMVGVIQITFGLLKVGNLSQFVSRSVLVGFTSAAGLLIAINQLPAALGLQLSPSRHLLDQLWGLLTNLPLANPYAVGVGGATVALVYAGRRWFPRWPAALVAVVATALVTYGYGLEARGVALLGPVPSGLPCFAWPHFDYQNFVDLAQNALAIAILGCIESLSIAKSISLSTGQRMNNNQDFLGMGLSHFVGSFFHCMPGCGSFTRSALNQQSGAATRVAGMLCAVWVAAILLIFGPLAQFIPKAALAGLLVALGLSLVKWPHIRVAARATKSDATVLILTFICTLVLHLETAIFVGVVSSLVLFLRKASAPHLVEYDLEGDSMREISRPDERSHPQISIIHVEGELFFGAAELFEDEVRRLAKDPNVRVVILRMKNARHLDATAVMALAGLYRFLRDDHRLLVISGASPDVMRVLRNSGLVEQIGADCVFEAEENLTAATRKALQRAQQFLGKETKPEVRVFYEQTRAEKGGPRGV
jgi:SulP family sulfate permease